MANDDSKECKEAKQDIVALVKGLPKICPKCKREVYEWYHFEPSPRTMVGELPTKFKESCRQEPSK